MLLHWFPPDVSVLPQLRRLNWCFQGDHIAPIPMSITKRLQNSGNLRHLSLLLTSDVADTYSTIINNLYPILTGLHSFKLHSFVRRLPPLVAVPDVPLIDGGSLIWRLPHLLVLNVDVKFTLTPTILASLSELPLQSLTLRRFSTSFTHPSPRCQFLALRDLSLTAAASDVLEIMQSISFPNATGLFLNIDLFSNGSSVPVQRAALNAIYSTFPVSLCRVYIDITTSNVKGAQEAVWSGPNAINFDDFVRPLQSLRNLRELTLRALLLVQHVRGLLDMPDGHLRSLVPSWPELELFEYTLHPNDYAMHPLPRDGPTLDTIFAFARAHPHLLHLQLPYMCTDDLLRGSDGLPPQDDASLPLEGHGLLWLKVGADACDLGAALEPVVLAVDRAFPQVRKEIHRNSGIIDPGYRWCLFEKELYALHAGEEAW